VGEVSTGVVTARTPVGATGVVLLSWAEALAAAGAPAPRSLTMFLDRMIYTRLAPRKPDFDMVVTRREREPPVSDFPLASRPCH
jgi:hypothetical protein